MDVPKRIVDVFVAAAASVVSVSGQKGGCPIHICRTPATSAAAIVFTAAAAFVPSMTSPTRSAVDILEPEFSFVKFSHPSLYDCSYYGNSMLLLLLSTGTANYRRSSFYSYSIIASIDVLPLCVDNIANAYMS